MQKALSEVRNKQSTQSQVIDVQKRFLSGQKMAFAVIWQAWEEADFRT